jgi:hypothetical protein
MDKETMYKNAVEIMREHYQRADTVEMRKGADWNANRIMNEMIEEGFTKTEAERAKLEAKFNVNR